MRPEVDFLNLPIHSLQYMLRLISLHYPDLPRLIPDGIFGEKTLEAVMRFQKQMGRPVTGRVDNDTWDTIVTIYRQILPEVTEPRPVDSFPHRAFTVTAGQCCIHIYLIQAMFLALAQVVDGLEFAPVNGSHTGPSVRNVVWLQHRAGLPETGVVDIRTWAVLSRTYELFVARNAALATCPERSSAPVTSPGTRGFPWEPYPPTGPCGPRPLRCT